MITRGADSRPSDEDLSPGTPTLERQLTVVKVAKPNQDMLFDVPVIGIKTIDLALSALGVK